MELDDEPWEPFAPPVDPSPGAPEPSTQAPEPPPIKPEGTKRMYEPPPPAGYAGPADYDEPGGFVPPQDDFAAGPPVSGPPGRQYVMYRQPPTWQHASIEGLGGVTTDVLASFLSNLVVIAAGAGLGYFLTGTPKGAGGGALAIVGASQLPHMFKAGGLVRAVIAAASLGGAYWLLADESGLLEQRAMRNAGGEWDYENNDDDDDEPSREDVGAKPSDDPSEPAKSAPWMKQVA